MRSADPQHKSTAALDKSVRNGGPMNDLVRVRLRTIVFLPGTSDALRSFNLADTLPFFWRDPNGGPHVGATDRALEDHVRFFLWAAEA